MAQTTAEKKSRFARVAVPRIETAIDLFRKLGNCSSKSNYEWDQLKLKKVFVHILIAVQDCAAKFDLDVHFTIDEVSSQDLYDPDALEEFLK
jgi:hypothetical protein